METNLKRKIYHFPNQDVLFDPYRNLHIFRIENISFRALFIEKPTETKMNVLMKKIIHKLKIFFLFKLLKELVQCTYAKQCFNLNTMVD